MIKFFKYILVFSFSFCLLFSQGINGSIISLAPNITEIICYLDGEKRLVGVTADCNYPEGVKTKAKVGKYTYPDLEKIILLQPAVVVAEDTIDKRFLKKLKKYNIEYKLYNFQKLESFFSELKILNKELELKNLLKITQLESIYNQQQQRQSKKIVIILWQDPYVVAGKDVFLSKYFEQIGWHNIIKQNKYPRVTREVLFEEDLDMVVNLSGKRLSLTKEPEDKVKIIDNLNLDIMLRLSPRLIKYYEKIPL